MIAIIYFTHVVGDKGEIHSLQRREAKHLRQILYSLTSYDIHYEFNILRQF